MKRAALFVVFVCCIFLSSLTLHGIIPVSERDALIALYNSTAGAGWTDNTNWNGAHGTENTWFGITTSWTGANEHVVGINLESNNLVGTIPADLGNLTYLESLDMSGNSLSGTIPTVSGPLPNLHTLDLGYNMLSGSIPSAIGGLTALQTLVLGYNNFSGTIPTELGSLTNLRILYLRRNELTGGIPSTLGDLVELTTLNLSANQLYGVIPAELGSLRNLWYFYIDGNSLSGPLPSDLGNLTTLRRFYCNENNLTGNIPPEMGNLENLQRLRLAHNSFNGAIPPELGNITTLQSLTLYSNDLTGSIPATMQNLTNLGVGSLNIKWNGLFTDDDALRTFLNSRQVDGDWESSQTKAPDNVAAVSTGYDSIRVSWDPIVFTGYTGGYRVLYSTVSGGPYTYFGITADKTVTQMDVTGLSEGTTYYLVVQTRTNPHEYNTRNTVDSEYSAEVSAATTGDDISGFVRTSGGQGVADVVLTFSNSGGTAVTLADGSYSQTVPHGWSGTVTPALAGYTFDPATRTYNNVTGDFTAQNYTAIAVTPLISGRVTLGGSGLAGVTLTFSNGGGSTVTGSDGNYSHAVSYSWSGSVTPSMAGYTFNPASRTYTGVASDQTGQDYTASAVTPVISGRVTFGGSGLDNVTLTFSNGGGSTTTTGDGNYSHAVTYGWTGTVTPSLAGYSFSPSSRNYTNITANEGGENYTASEVTPVISGRVSIGGTGLSNVTLTFSNGGGTAVTDNDGNYSRTVTYGWSGSATPSRQGYTFNPTSRNYNNVTGNEGDEDYAAAAVTPLISGRVTVNGAGLPNVTLAFSNSGGTAVTDNNGNYSHAVSYNWSGTVTPSRIGYTFEPADRSYSNVTADISGENYAATFLAPVITGRVTTADGTPLDGVTLTFSGLGTVVTDTGGVYSHSVVYGWSGSVTPFKEGYTFEPVSRTYSFVTTGFSGQDFIAAAVKPVISGYVTDANGTGIPGVSLSFSGGVTASTDANGYYAASVSYGWSGDVTPSKDGFTFDPTARTYTDVTTDQSGDYIATAVSPVISGRVSTADGTGIFEVLLTFSNSGGTVTTDANGNYVQAVPYGWSGTVTPFKTGFSIDPASRTYTDVTTGQTGQNYTGNAITPLISGRVTDADGMGLSGVTLVFSNAGGTVTTDSNGYYLNAVPFQWSGTVIPSKTGYIFEPGLREYDEVSASRSAQDYTGTAVIPVISGRVLRDDGSGVSGVVLHFSPGDMTAVTDAGGNYSKAVNYGWSGTVTPALTGFYFLPEHQSYSNVTGGVTGQDYTAMPAVILNLQVSLEKERAWVVSSLYSDITLTYENYGGVEIAKIILYRKAGDGNYTNLEEFQVNPAAGSETFTLLDTDLDKEVSYTYKAEAVNENGEVIGLSEEISI